MKMVINNKKIKSDIRSRCLNSNQFTLEKLYKLCRLTDMIRKICSTKEGANYVSTLLDDKRAILYFKQSSTRTFLSFKNACHILGIKSSDIRDVNTSSAIKGETELDAIKTFSQYTDLTIIRHPSTDFIYSVSDYLDEDIRIINAGSGIDQHPTQALLDFYTIYKYGIENKTIAFVGDLRRGRTVRSLALLLNKVDNVKFYFVAPNGYQITQDIIEQLNVDYEITDDFDKIITIVDIIYMTRLQDEYGGIEEAWDEKRYKIDSGNIDRIKKNSIILHPLPRRDEIAHEIDDDPRAKYWEQTENGLWIRVALIATMFNITADLLENKYKDISINYHI